MNKTLLAHLRKYNIEEDAVFEITCGASKIDHKYVATCFKAESQFTAQTSTDAIMLLKAQIVKEHNSFAIIEPYNDSEKLLSVYNCGRLVLTQRWVM